MLSCVTITHVFLISKLLFMKHRFFRLLMALNFIFLVSCQKNNDDLLSQNKNELNTTSTSSSVVVGKVNQGEQCPETVTQLTAGQQYNAGSVAVSNDESFIYVTYTTGNDYLLTQTHLFVGNCNAIPVNNQGNPVPGQFPYKMVHSNATSYTYQIPISAIPMGSCGCIAAHAVVVKLNTAGQVIEQQTAWGSGVRINPTGNWGMKFSFCSCTL
jgi:hypothetical protein